MMMTDTTSSDEARKTGRETKDRGINLSNLLDTLKDSTAVERSNKFFDYMYSVAKEKRLPHIGTFELTPRCTLDCAMCFVHLKEEQMHCKELSTEQWLSLIDQACDAGMLKAQLTGGECLLHPGFRTICQALLDRGAIVSVFTNATLLDEETVDWIAKRPIELIQVSVYGSTPEAYRAVTGSAAAFYKVDKALDLLKAAGVRFIIAITTSKQLAPDVEKLYSYCREKGPNRIFLSPNPFPARTDTGRKQEDFRMNVQESVAYYNKFFKIVGNEKSACAFPEDEMEASLVPAQNTEEIPMQGIPCSAGKAAFCISWDGYMNPCNALYWMKARPLEDGFTKAWQDTKEAACTYRYPTKCKGCTYRRACPSCPGIHYKSDEEPSVVNLAICEETKALVKEGFLRI